MKTKEQKKKEITQGEQLLESARSLVFTDFTGTSFEAVKKLKTELKKAGATFKVIKKRLLKIALKNKSVDFDPTQFGAQVGTAFAPGELTDGAASAIYKFAKEQAKEKKPFHVLGAYELAAKRALTAEEFTVLAKLPGREVLLGQLVGMLTVPIRQFMVVLQERGKQLQKVV